MTARVSGGRDGEAVEWLGADVRYLDLRSGEMLSGFSVGQAGVAELWGSSRLETGHARTVRLIATEYAEFLVTFGFRYIAGGATQSASFSTACHL